jgi:DNA repair photolyase
VGIVTKSALIRRDIDVLQKSREASLGVYFSIPFDDYDIARLEFSRRRRTRVSPR